MGIRLVRDDESVVDFKYKMGQVLSSDGCTSINWKEIIDGEWQIKNF